MRVEVLGPLRVVGDGLGELSRASHRRLLALLALERGRRVGTEVLIDRFWAGSPPDSARAAIQTHVSAVRKLLGSEVIRTEGNGYRLDVDVVSLDVVEFDRAASDVRAAISDSNWDATVSRSSSALELWRGAPFPVLADDGFARAEIVRLEEARLELWESWSGSLIRSGRPDEALTELERLVVEHPYRERLWEHLMTARYRLGRHPEALDAYRELVGHLAEIGLEPGPELRRLEQKILLHQVEADATPNNLPAELTSFVGREKELREVAKLLDEHRLLTLTGVGGGGKTRLGIRAASEAVEGFGDGCWFVALADLDEPSLVPGRVCEVLGIQPRDEDPLAALVSSICHDEMLLVLDNCEHLVAGAGAVVEGLLSVAGKVRIVATSREPLHAPGEAVYDVPPLASPDRDVAGEAVSGYDAVRLFVDRATLVDPTFRPDADTYLRIGELCRRLDGLPLAIELAAARIRSFAVDQLVAHLDERFRLLARGASTALARHQTLHAAIDWSYRLLDEPDQAVFRRLFVFVGGFTYDAAKAVCAGDPDAGPPPDMLEVLPGLVDKSLVVADQTDDGVRYRLLETVRQFARERCDAGESERWRRRHAEYYASEFDRDQRRASSGPDGLAVLHRLEVEGANLQAALAWAVDAGETDMAVGLSWWLTAHSMGWVRWSDLLPWFEALEDVLEERGPPERMAEVLLSHGDWAWGRGDRDRAVAVLERAVAIFRELDAQGADHDRLLAFPETLSTWAHYLLLSRRVGANNEIYADLQQELLEVSQRLGDQYQAAKALANMAQHGDPGGDPATARRLFERSEEATRDVSPNRAAYLANQWASFEFSQGEFEDAARLWDRGAALSERAGKPKLVILARTGAAACRAELGGLGAMDEFRTAASDLLARPGAGGNLHDHHLVLAFGACVDAALGQFERVAMAAGLSETLARRDVPLRWDLVGHFETTIERARSALGDEAFEASRDRGAALDEDGLVPFLREQGRGRGSVGV